MTIEQAFGFIDLAGYTALTDAHGDDAAAALAGRFCDLARESLSTEVTLVKSIGDAVMLTSTEPVAVLDSADRLLRACLREPGFPVARAGVHTGSAVERDNDWFGAAVNVAARVCALAAGHELLITSAVAEAAVATGRVLHTRDPVQLRGIAKPVLILAVDMGEGDPHAVMDPVCRMRCDTRTAAGSLKHDGRQWWFCSLGCASLFIADPAAYTR